LALREQKSWRSQYSQPGKADAFLSKRSVGHNELLAIDSYLTLHVVSHTGILAKPLKRRSRVASTVAAVHRRWCFSATRE
jgi:hypothetical protein